MYQHVELLEADLRKLRKREAPYKDLPAYKRDEVGKTIRRALQSAARPLSDHYLQCALCDRDENHSA